MNPFNITRRGLLAAACAAPLAAYAPGLLAQTPDTRPALFLIGDSIIRNGTHDNGGTNQQWGWGHMMQWHFDLSRIHVVNDAMGGTSSRSFMESPNLWPRVKQMIRPGDFVMIGFGHNDSRGSLKGNGDETGVLPPAPARPARPSSEASAVARPLPPVPAMDPVAVHSFGWYIREYIRQIRQIREAGATPIVLSLIPRNRWSEGRIGADGKDYAVWAQEAAAQAGALFLPLNDLVTDRFNEIGQTRVTADLFPPGETVHPNWTGAALIASLVVDGIRRLDSPLKTYLVAAPQVPTMPDIVHPTPGFMGASAMEPKTRTPAAL